MLVKDNIQAAGMPATAGSPALLDTESADAFLVARLREAGAVILGKANLSEWANFRSTHSTSGWSTLGGQAVNPRGAGRNPSGSSSGSGVAVAAGLAPLAIGTETDGSIVCPAQLLRDRGDQADDRAGQPDRDRAGLARPGHRGPDGSLRRRRRGPVVRACRGQRR